MHATLLILGVGVFGVLQDDWTDAEVAVKKKLTEEGPMKGFAPGTEFARVESKELSACYPSLRFYTAKHETRMFEYPDVRSLAVVDVKGMISVIIDRLYTDDGWPEFLGRLAGIPVKDAGEAEKLTAAIGAVLARVMCGERAVPKEFPVSKPRDGTFEVTLHAEENWRRILVVTVGDKKQVSEVRIDTRKR